jgi:hypothetical protein
MTVVLKNPLTPRRFKWIIVIVLLVTAVGIPATLYWALQRSDMHLRWDLESRYAQEFYFQSDYAAGLLNGDVTPPTNITIGIASNELAGANDELYNIGYLDTSHINTISRITTALATLDTQGRDSLDYFQSLNSTQRSFLATQLRLLGHDIENAYWNYLNFTSTSPGVGPPFWYSGPSPPDSQLLQDAVSVALGIQRT